MCKNFLVRLLSIVMFAFLMFATVLTPAVLATDVESNQSADDGVSRAELLELADQLIVLDKEKDQLIATMVFYHQMSPFIMTTYSLSAADWDYDRANELYQSLLEQEQRFYAAIAFDNVVRDIMRLDGENRIAPMLQGMAINRQEWFLNFDQQFTVSEIESSTDYLRSSYNFALTL